MKIWQTAALAVPLIAASTLVPGQANASSTATPSAASAARYCYYNVHSHGHYWIDVWNRPYRPHYVVGHLYRYARHIRGECHSHYGYVHIYHPYGWVYRSYLYRSY
ncbi:hypothetical protein [Actinomadura oligospora]|uniref:hypothetical protein n=1 Tax=Actinomadura oligospora TaxID=111804 RepID=UPI00047D23A0|nr:hypothetical protein [Actinomadura oligospora]